MQDKDKISNNILRRVAETAIREADEWADMAKAAAEERDDVLALAKERGIVVNGSLSAEPVEQSPTETAPKKRRTHVVKRRCIGWLRRALREALRGADDTHDGIRWVTTGDLFKIAQEARPDHEPMPKPGSVQTALRKGDEFIRHTGDTLLVFNVAGKKGVAVNVINLKCRWRLDAVWVADYQRKYGRNA